MNRREYVAAALLGATAGCLRLQSDGSTTTGTTEGSDDTTTTGGATTGEASTAESTSETNSGSGSVSAFEVSWTHEDAGLDVNFRPNRLVADGEGLLAFGPRVARVDPSEPATLARTDPLEGNVTTTSVQSTLVTEDAIYVGYRSDPPRVARLARDASGVEWTAAMDASFEDVTGLAVVDDAVYAGATARRSGGAGLYALEATSGDVAYSYEWGDDHDLQTVSVHDGIVYLGLDGDDDSPNAIDASTREAFATADRFGFDGGRRVRATADGLYVVGNQGLRVRDWGSFDLRFEHSLAGFPQTPPVRRGDALYLSNEPGLRAFDAESGTERWLTRTTGLVADPPTFHDGVAFVHDREDVVYAIDIATGEIQHEVAPFELSIGDLAFVDGSLIAAMNGLRGLTVVRDGPPAVAAAQD